VKPPDFQCFCIFRSAWKAYLTSMTHSTTTPRPGTPPAQSRCTKQFWSCPHGLQLFLSIGVELPTTATACRRASFSPIGHLRSHILLVAAWQRQFMVKGCMYCNLTTYSFINDSMVPWSTELAKHSVSISRITNMDVSVSRITGYGCLC
jgi:hypothetical protein